MIRGSRLAGVVMLASLALAACAAAPGVSSPGTSGGSQAQIVVPAPISAAPRIQAQPQVVGQPAESTPPAAPVTIQSFALFPFGNGGAHGTVTVRLQASGFAVSVAVQGLVPGTPHSIHLHAGSCGAAVAGTHLVILGTIAANGAGSGSIASHVALRYSPGRFVIVYANLSPATIIGCADLGTI